jgi:hypothetical protein|nr:MAG TPA: hypothetical protein [Caudoviricetes sp.]
MGALYLTLTKSYKAENPRGGEIFLDVTDFRMIDDFLTIDHRVLTRDCIFLEMTTTIARRYIVDIQAFVNARDLHNYLGLYTDIYTPVWNSKDVSFVIEREVEHENLRFYIDIDVVNVEEVDGELTVTYYNGMKNHYPKSEALRWRVINYCKMR